MTIYNALTKRMLTETLFW